MESDKVWTGASESTQLTSLDLWWQSLACLLLKTFLLLWVLTLSVEDLIDVKVPITYSYFPLLKIINFKLKIFKSTFKWKVFTPNNLNQISKLVKNIQKGTLTLTSAKTSAKTLPSSHVPRLVLKLMNRETLLNLKFQVPIVLIVIKNIKK